MWVWFFYFVVNQSYSQFLFWVFMVVWKINRIKKCMLQTIRHTYRGVLFCPIPIYSFCAIGLQFNFIFNPNVGESFFDA